MTPAARIQTAIDLLDAILTGVPAEKALTAWARKSRFAGSKDRAAIRDHVYTALRRRRSCAALGGALSGRGLMIGALRDAGVDPASLFTGEGYGPPPLAEDELRAAQLTDRDRLDLPDWLIDRFEASLGEDTVPTALALRDRAAVIARVNLAKTSVPDAIAALAEEGIRARPDPVAATALVIEENARRLAASRSYTDGRIELQDGSSQAAMERLTITPGARVLDYCAGGGGKTLALAARNSAQWFAHDAHAQRLDDLGPRAARAGVLVTVLAQDDLARHAPFDLVLCDVPCSGSGTWRRTPETKWTLTLEGLGALCRMQQDILREAALLVAPDGTLAYATCSVLAEENDAQITAFLADYPHWACHARHAWPVSPSGDGFFLATLSRNSK